MKVSALAGPARLFAAIAFFTFSAFTQTVGAVYTITNDATSNKVLVFSRAEDGSLSGRKEFATGARGMGAGLGNQGGVILSPNQRFLFVVNAGSNSITGFEITATGLRLTDTFSSRGTRPISLTMHGNLLYVLNAGSDDIIGFRVNANGTATPLGDSRRKLSGTNVGGAQIQFNTQGDALVVTEKATNIIDTFSVGANGRPASVRRNLSAGQTPFGFAFGPRDSIYVSEAFGGATGASAMSSYRLSANDTLQTLSASVGTTQTAACWVVMGEGGRFAYTTNAGSGSISSYRVAFDGTLQLLNARAANTGNSPIDMSVSDNQRFLYVLSQASGTIGGFRIQTDGSLDPISGLITGLPAFVDGLAAR